MTDSSSKKISVAGAAEMGSIKTVNEDAYESYRCGNNKIYLVASGNGVGTSGKGKVALDMVSAALGKTFKEYEAKSITHEDIVQSLREVNRAVFERSLEEPKYAGMAVSLSLVLVAQQRAYVVHIGNTRVYMISGTRIEQLTKDHTLAEELKRTGALGATNPSSPMAQVLTRAIGKAPHIEPDVFSFSLEDLDDNRLVVCSKGIYNRVEDHEILEDVLEGAPEIALSKTIKRAKEKSAADNFALVIIDPNGYQGEGSATVDVASAITDSSEVKSKPTESSPAESRPTESRPAESRHAIDTVKDAIVSSEQKLVDVVQKLEEKRDVFDNANSGAGLKTGDITKSGNLEKIFDPPLSFTSAKSSPINFSVGSSSSKPGPSYPSSPFSALVAPSIESTGARAGVEFESPSEKSGIKDGLDTGTGQSPPGFEQESSGHLKPRGSGTEAKTQGALKGGISESVEHERGERADHFSSRKTSTSLETTVSGRGQPQFDEDDETHQPGEGSGINARSALSKLGRAILVGVVVGSLLGRFFNRPTSEPVKPAVTKQQVVEVAEKGREKNPEPLKVSNGGDDSQHRDRETVVKSQDINEAPSDDLQIRQQEILDSSRGGLVEGVKIGVLKTEEVTGLDRALGRKLTPAPRQDDANLTIIQGVEGQPEQLMRARAGVANLVEESRAGGVSEGTSYNAEQTQPNLKKGQALVTEANTRSVAVVDGDRNVSAERIGIEGRGLGRDKGASLTTVIPPITANEVINKFPQLSKISDPDLRLMLTDVLSAFEETARISKQELVEVEAERQRLNARLEVIERHIIENLVKNEERSLKTKEVESADVVTRTPVAEQGAKDPGPAVGEGLGGGAKISPPVKLVR